MKKNKWTVEIETKGTFYNGLYQVWDKSGNAPSDDEQEKIKELIEKALNT